MIIQFGEHKGFELEAHRTVYDANWTWLAMHFDVGGVDHHVVLSGGDSDNHKVLRAETCKVIDALLSKDVYNIMKEKYITQVVWHRGGGHSVQITPKGRK